ncbi:hypothetical protein HWV62_27027 [Athelia sp. TMB]|nr:hypothetical protein HWV62_27027 [Athelia sp. TMB]
MDIKPAFYHYHAIAAAFAKTRVGSPKGILAHVSIEETIEDWNSVREALGYENALSGVDLESYARKDTQHVGNFVLDAVEPRGLGKGDVIKAWTTIIARAVVGNSTNATAADVRAMTILACFSYRPNFPA